MILKRPEVVNELRKRTKFYKGPTEEFVNALEEMLIECLGKAELDDGVEIHLAKGLVIGSYKLPEREAKDPRTQEDIITPEKIYPYAKFTHTFKQKINE